MILPQSLCYSRGIGSYQTLLTISDRLYCINTAFGRTGVLDDLEDDHYYRMGRLLRDLFEDLQYLIEQEEERLKMVEEEMKKFEQGFSYVGTKSTQERRD